MQTANWLKANRRKAIGAIIVTVGIVGFLLARPGTSGRADTNSKTMTVATIQVVREDLSHQMAVQGEFRPFQEIDLHPKVAGFLEKMNVDIGDTVKQGQLIAVIEVPELQDDLVRADAVVKRSEQDVIRDEAAYEEARLANQRLMAAAKAQPNLIAQQDLDVVHARERVIASTLASAREQVQVAGADVRKLKTMLGFSRIVAPFSGVITRRNADPGQMIQAGTASSTQATPLVRLSQMDRLRLVFPVSMSYVSRVKLGDEVEVRVESPSKILRAKISRFTHKVETATRAMDVEVDVENSDLSLIAGMYASVLLTLEHHDRVLSVPVQAVTRGESPSVLVINSRQELEERRVKLGLETPTSIEIVEGLKEGDSVVLGSRTLFKPGQKVEAKTTAARNDKDQ